MLFDDPSVYTDPSGTGDLVTIGTGTMDGVFDRLFVTINNVEGYHPTFLISNADAATITIESTVMSFEGVSYKAISKQPDGTGFTLLVLRKS
jgi:hypothetical protein